MKTENGTGDYYSVNIVWRRTGHKVAKALDEWRRNQSDVPSRTGALKRIIEAAIGVEEEDK